MYMFFNIELFYFVFMLLTGQFDFKSKLNSLQVLHIGKQRAINLNNNFKKLHLVYGFNAAWIKKVREILSSA